MIPELSFGTQASFPALGFETAVSATFSTSPPDGSQELLKGDESNKLLEINDLPTSLSIMYETSPIEIFLLGQNLSLIELHAGITSLAAKYLFHLSIYLHLHLNIYLLIQKDLLLFQL